MRQFLEWVDVTIEGDGVGVGFSSMPHFQGGVYCSDRQNRKFCDLLNGPVNVEDARVPHGHLKFL